MSSQGGTIKVLVSARGRGQTLVPSGILTSS